MQAPLSPRPTSVPALVLFCAFCRGSTWPTGQEPASSGQLASKNSFPNSLIPSGPWGTLGILEFLGVSVFRVRAFCSRSPLFFPRIPDVIYLGIWFDLDFRMSLQHRSPMEAYFRSIETKPEVVAKERQFMDSLRQFYRQKWFVFGPPALSNNNLQELLSEAPDCKWPAVKFI